MVYSHKFYINQNSITFNLIQQQQKRTNKWKDRPEWLEQNEQKISVFINSSWDYVLVLQCTVSCVLFIYFLLLKGKTHKNNNNNNKTQKHYHQQQQKKACILFKFSLNSMACSEIWLLRAHTFLGGLVSRALYLF